MKTAELQKDMFDMQQKVKRYKERIYELESELEKTAATIATLQEKVLTALNRWNNFWLPGFPDVSLSQSKFARRGISRGPLRFVSCPSRFAFAFVRDQSAKHDGPE